MRLFCTKRVGFALAGLLCLPTLFASTPEWLRVAAQTPLSQRAAPAEEVVLLDEQVTTVAENGEMRTLYRRAYKILHPEVARRKLVGVYFDSETRLTYLKGWSLSPGTKETEIKEKDAVETSPFSGELYQDTHYKVLAIPAAVPGIVIGYEYEQRRRSAVLQDIWQVQQQIPVCLARFHLQLPRGWTYQANWLHHPGVEPHTESDTQWVWQLENVPAVGTEPGMPDWRAVAGSLGLTYSRPSASSGPPSRWSWRDVGEWYAHLTADRCRSQAGIRQKVRDLTAAAPAMVDKIRTLAAFVQKEIRYVAIEVGTGGYQPHAAEEVLSNRYGDCKDKATLLRAMLREAGIESSYVLVNSTRGVVNPDFPSVLGFNHVILAIRIPAETRVTGWHSLEPNPLRGTLLYFDPTDTLVPLGLLPESLQTSYGLVVSDTGGEVRQLPMIASSINKLLRVAQLTLTASGGLQGTVTELRTGALASEVRGPLVSASGAERRKLLEALLASFAGSSVLQAVEVENLENPELVLIIHYRFEATGYAKRAGDLLLLRPWGLGQKTEALLEAKTDLPRQHPLEWPYASVESEDVKIALPAGYTIDELPAPLDLTVSCGEYHSQGAMTASTLEYKQVYERKALRVPVEQWDEWRKFQGQVIAEERNHTVLKAVR